MEFRRPIFSEVLDRMNEPRRFIQVLAGPRQVGKSSLPKFRERFNPKRDLVIGTDGIPLADFFNMKIEDLL